MGGGASARAGKLAEDHQQRGQSTARSDESMSEDGPDEAEAASILTSSYRLFAARS